MWICIAELKLGGAGIPSWWCHQMPTACLCWTASLRRHTQINLLRSPSFRVSYRWILDLFPLYHCLQQCIDLVEVRHDVWFNTRRYWWVCRFIGRCLTELIRLWPSSLTFDWAPRLIVLWTTWISCFTQGRPANLQKNLDWVVWWVWPKYRTVQKPHPVLDDPAASHTQCWMIPLQATPTTGRSTLSLSNHLTTSLCHLHNLCIHGLVSWTCSPLSWQAKVCNLSQYQAAFCTKSASLAP